MPTKHIGNGKAWLLSIDGIGRDEQDLFAVLRFAFHLKRRRFPRILPIPTCMRLEAQPKKDRED
jgi:hypothetical protein